MKMLILIIMLLFTACSTPANQATLPSERTLQNTTTKSPASKQVIETIAANLQTPWAIDFDQDTIYMSERVGTIAEINGKTLKRQNLSLTKPVYASGEGGLLGFVLAPDFSISHRAYIYHTYKAADKILNRVILIEKIAEGWKEIKVLIEDIPGSSIHNGGRLAIGPDKNLYITTGDSSNGELAQNLSSLGGKILRMTLEGLVPKDNPFPNSYVYSYGHRNVQGIAWNDQGQMYSSEHGPSGTPGGHDEINRIASGNNYGWPLIIGDEKHDGMVNPLYHTGEKAIAPSGITFNKSGNILIAALRGEGLYQYDINRNKLNIVLENEGRIRDVKIHQGKIYVITNNTDGRGRPSNIDDRLLLLSNVE